MIAAPRLTESNRNLRHGAAPPIKYRDTYVIEIYYVSSQNWYTRSRNRTCHSSVATWVAGG